MDLWHGSLDSLNVVLRFLRRGSLLGFLAWFFRLRRVSLVLQTRFFRFFRRGSLVLQMRFFGSSDAVLCYVLQVRFFMFFIRGSLLRLSLWFFKHSSLSSFFRYGSLGFSGSSLVGSLVLQTRLSRFFRCGFYSFKEKKI